MRKRSNPDSEQNIKRIDTKPRAKKQTHGFQVHFVRGSSTGTRMFSDAVYGGKEQARKAARKYRREVMGDLPPRTTLTKKAASKPAAKKVVAKKAAAKKTRPKKPVQPRSVVRRPRSLGWRALPASMR